MAFSARDVIPLSQARANLSELAEQVKAGAEKIVTKNGESYIALIDAQRLDYYHQLERARIHLLLLDDAHGLGVMGPQGRGALAAAGLTGANASRHILYMSTLSKAVGVAGGFVAGDATLVEWVLQKARSYTFATAAPALLAEAIRAALRRIAQGDALRDQLHARILQLRRGLMPAADSLACGGLPLGLAHGVALKRAVAKGETVKWSDVGEIDNDAARFRREMERVFGAAPR